MLHPGDDRIESHLILAPFGDDQIGVALGGLDELLVHRADGGQILIDYRLQRAAACLDVTHQPADESDIGRGVHEQLDIDPPPELRFGQDQDPSTMITRRGSTRWVSRRREWLAKS